MPSPDNLLLRAPLVVLALGLSPLVVVVAISLFTRFPVIGELALLALTIAVPALLLLSLTLGSDCGFCDDAASSVSHAPGP